MKVINLSGQRFGKLTVLERTDNSSSGKSRWVCQCDCGNTTVVTLSNLRCGKVQSCGCSNIKDLTGMKFGKWAVIKLSDTQFVGKSMYWDCICECGTIRSVSSDSLVRGKSTSCGCTYRHDLTGMKFGRLSVISWESRNFVFSAGNHYKKIIYKCKCDCGKEIEVESSALLNGSYRSCGCYHNELLSKLLSTHGQSKTRLYNIWCNIIARCTNSNTKSYIDYGGRGISICKEWRKFENFMEWAISHGYAENLTIERIDVDGDYCPENCTWIPKKEQANNTRRSVIIEMFGVKKSLKQWTDFMGWKYSKYENRHLRGKLIFCEDEQKRIEYKLRSEK